VENTITFSRKDFAVCAPYSSTTGRGIWAGSGTGCGIAMSAQCYTLINWHRGVR